MFCISIVFLVAEILCFILTQITMKYTIKSDLIDTLNNTHYHVELPTWLAEGVYQYLSLSAQEKQEQLLEAKAHFAVQKRQWTYAHLNAAASGNSKEGSTWQFIMGVVDFLQKDNQEGHLYYGLKRKWKKFVKSSEIGDSYKWPVDYLLKRAFASA